MNIQEMIEKRKELGLGLQETCELLEALIEENANLTTALQKVINWDLPLEFRVDYGSNGERDHFRSVAHQALSKTK